VALVMTTDRLADAPANADAAPRCWRCDKALAVFLTRPWQVICPRCKATNKRDALAQDESIK
jgi:Zn finger protein HypA/HybF involved in hydrogenase expression